MHVNFVIIGRIFGVSEGLEETPATHVNTLIAYQFAIIAVALIIGDGGVFYFIIGHRFGLGRGRVSETGLRRSNGARKIRYWRSQFQPQKT